MSESIRTRSVGILLLAAAYFVMGKLGLLLAIAPGYVTPVYPPAGIALAALLLWPRLWPGILLGALLVNLSVSYDASDSAGLLRSILIAAGLGAGALLQGLGGAQLIRRTLGRDPELSSERQAFTFLLLGGPIASIINASCSVLTLVGTNVIPSEAFAYSWATPSAR